MRLEITALPGGFGSSVKIDGKEFNYCVSDIEIAETKGTKEGNIFPKVTITFIPEQLVVDSKALELFCPRSKERPGKSTGSGLQKSNCC